MHKSSALVLLCLTGLGTLAQAQADVPRSAFKPEMFVRYPDSSVLCDSKEALGEFMIRAAKGEKTKANAVFSESCIFLAKKGRYKVLSVDFPEGNAFGVLEIVGDSSKSARGGWALTTGAVPAK